MESFDSINPDGIVGGYTVGNPQPNERAEDELLSQLRLLHEHTKKARTSVHADWEYNKLALKGYVNIGRLRGTDTILRIVTSTSLRKPPATDNVCIANWRAWVGKQVGTFTTVEVRPPSSKASDRYSAAALTALLRFFERDQKILEKKTLGAMREFWCGNSILIPEWKPMGGEKIAACPKCGYVSTKADEMTGQDCPPCKKEEALRVDAALSEHALNQQEASLYGMPPEEVPGNPENPPQIIEENIPKLEAGRRGRLGVDLYRMQEVYVDPGATSIEDAEWITIERPLAVQQLRRLYPEHIDSITADAGLLEDQWIGIGADNRTALYQRELKDHALLHITFERPTAAFEEGRRIHWLDNKVLKIEEYTVYNKLGRHPVFHFGADALDDLSILRRPPMDDIYPLQDELNQLLRDKRAFRAAVLHPKLITLKDSGINQKTFDDTAGQVILMNNKAGMVMKPYYLQPPNMPSFVDQDDARLKEAIREKAGVTSHEMGTAPAGESARHAAFLDAQSKGSNAGMVKLNQSEWIELYRAMLIIAHLYMDDDQLWEIESGGTMHYYSWRDVMLEPPYHVHLVEAEALSRNPVVRAQQAQGWLQDGVFNDPATGVPDMKKYATVAGIADLVIDVDDDATARHHAREIIEKIKQTGQIPEARSWDNALVIAQTMLEWLRDEGYNEENEPYVQMIEQLWFKYAQASLASEQQRMMAQQGMKAAGVMPNPQLMNPGGQAPGAAGPSGPDDTSAASTPGQERETAATDRTNQGMARGGKPQEGSTTGP